MALHFDDKLLIHKLLKLGAYKYNGIINSSISAYAGDYSKLIHALNNYEYNNIYNCFEFLFLVPDYEFSSFIKGRGKIKRDRRVVLTIKQQRKIIALIKRYILERNCPKYQRDPIIEIVREQFKKRNFFKAHQFIKWLEKSEIFFAFNEFKLGHNENLEMQYAFEFGDINYINSFPITKIVSEITESHTNRCSFYNGKLCCKLVPDEHGDELWFHWHYAQFITPELIGKDLYERIIEEMNTNKSRYLL